MIPPLDCFDEAGAGTLAPWPMATPEKPHDVALTSHQLPDRPYHDLYIVLSLSIETHDGLVLLL